MTIAAIEQLATQVLVAKGDLNKLGHNWYYQFLQRHPELRIRRSRALDQSRKDATDYEILQHWFELFRTILLKYSIIEGDFYNMDEKGCIKGQKDSLKVIIL